VGTAIMQTAARSPANCAMTAMTLNQLSGGRFMLGIGASGPQVVEGWHGVGYARPLTRSREYIEIIRRIMAREAPVTYDGKIYQLPYSGPGSVGLGKPLKSILKADPTIPIYSASITPKGLEMSGEIADGVFPLWMDPDNCARIRKPLEAGFAKAGKGKSLANFDVAPFVTVVMGEDMAACQAPVRANLALYIGGMGARDKNFYTDYVSAMGYADAAHKIQDLYLSGKKQEAEAALPDELIDAVALVGSASRIKDRLQAWKAAGDRGEVGSMLLACRQPEAAMLIANEVL